MVAQSICIAAWFTLYLSTWVELLYLDWKTKWIAVPRMLTANGKAGLWYCSRSEVYTVIDSRQRTTIYYPWFLFSRWHIHCNFGVKPLLIFICVLFIWASVVIGVSGWVVKIAYAYYTLMKCGLILLNNILAHQGWFIIVYLLACKARPFCGWFVLCIWKTVNRLWHVP